jgi:hypothetical protein
MTPEEVYLEIDKDMENLAEWWCRVRVTQQRIAKWTIKLPRTTWFDFESKRKNRYLVMNIIMGRKYNDESMTCVLALQKKERGFAVYTSRFPWQHIASPHAIMPHVFDRYHDPERGNVKKTGIELIKHFMERNAYGEISRGDKFSGRSVRYKGRDNIAKCVTDGVLLGEMTNDIFVAHTFITYEMATGLQREEFEKNKGMILSNYEIMRRCKQQDKDMERMMIEEARETAALMVSLSK